MPSPIYMQKRVNPLQRYIPYLLQYGLNKQRQGFLGKQAEAKRKHEIEQGKIKPTFHKIEGMPNKQLVMRGKEWKIIERKETPEQIERRKRVGEVRKGIAQEAKEGRALRDKKDLADYNQGLKKDLADYNKKFGNTPPDALNANQRRILEQSLAQTTEKIEMQPENPAVKGQIEFYNKMATGNSVYVWRSKREGKKNKWGWTTGGKPEQAERVQLPYSDKLKRRLNAQDVRDSMVAHPTATLEDILIGMGAIK